MSAASQKKRAQRRAGEKLVGFGQATWSKEGVPILRAILPGALLYQHALPSGLLTCDPPRRAQFHTVGDSPVFASVPKDELSAVLGSAAKTYTRGAYHESRFRDLRRELDLRRDLMPGHIVWDSLLEYVHFELQAFTGACRTLVDELVYVIARRHGIGPKQARRKPWTTSDLFHEPLVEPFDVGEIRALRTQVAWFDILNSFRNTFFHHGWRHGGGHFAPNEPRRSSQFAASNGLLVPDRASLLGKSKPHEWTWNQKTTVDDIAGDVRAGTEEMLRSLFEDHWATPIPAPGTMPLHERPNMIVGLVRPAIVETDGALFLPFFSTRESGLAFGPFSSVPDLELVCARSSTLVIGESAISIALAGLEDNQIPMGVTHIEAVLDPIHNAAWTEVQGTALVRVHINALIKQGTIQPLSLKVPGLSRAWFWQRTQEPRW